MVDDLSRGAGRGHVSAIGVPLLYAVKAVVKATVMVAFAGFAGALLFSSDKAWIGVLAAGILVVMTAVSIWGTRPVGPTQGLIAAVVVGVLSVLAVVTLTTMKRHLPAPPGYPAWEHAGANAGLAFVALLGLAIVTYAARPLERPARRISRAMWSSPILGRDLGVRAGAGLLVTAAVSLIVALSFNLTAVASIGGAAALLIFGSVTVGHPQICRVTGGRLRLLVFAMPTIVILLAAWVILLNGGTALGTVIGIAGLAVILDVLRSRIQMGQASQRPVLAVLKGGLHEY